MLSTAFQLANEESAQQLEKECKKARRRVASELLSSNVCPVKLELITGQHFLRYLLSLRKSSTNTRLSHSSYQTKRAALFHLFRSYNVPQPDDLQSNLNFLNPLMFRQMQFTVKFSMRRRTKSSARG